MTFRTKLTAAFADLRKAGFFARQNWQCCMSCGCAAIPEAPFAGYVFYHSQDADRLKQAEAGRGTRRFKCEDVGVHLAYGICGSAEEPDAIIKVAKVIVDVMRKHGLGVEWDGSARTRIWVHELAPVKSADEQYVEALEHLLAS